MPSSQPAYLHTDNLPELRDALNFILQDLYSKLDFALHLDGKGVMVELAYGGMGRDVSGFNGLIAIAGGVSGNLILGNGFVFDNTTGALYLNVTAKGDILAGTGNKAVAKLPIGTPGQVLSVGGAHATGLQWTAVIVDTENIKVDHIEEHTAGHGIIIDHPLTLPAGASAAGKSPLKFTLAGAALLTAPEVGVLEPFTDDLYYTITTGAARKGVVLTDGFPLTPGDMPVAGTNGRLEDGPTKTNVDSAIALKHTAGTDTALGAVGTKNPPIDADLALYRDSTAANALVTSTWTQVKAFLKTYFDTLYVAVTGRYRYAAALADGGIVTLPTTTANFPANGTITLAHASDGSIVGEAHFFFGSSGVVQIIEGTAATIEANGATAGKVSIGAAISANPVIVKNNLGGGTSVNVLITLSYG